VRKQAVFAFTRGSGSNEPALARGGTRSTPLCSTHRVRRARTCGKESYGYNAPARVPPVPPASAAGLIEAMTPRVR